MSEVADNLARMNEAVAEAARNSGRDASEVTLMAVSKTWPVEHVQLAVDAGHKVFGENKVQEGEVKIPAMSDELEWHMIGHLQRNKVRKMLPLFDVVHSVDSFKLANYMNNVAGDLGVKVRAYLQVNIAGEEQKSGFSPDQAFVCLDDLASLENLSFEGVMCIPPACNTAEEVRPWFAKTREFRGAIESKSGMKLPGLSMGMSSDYAVAIEEGSTIVRVGSSIFGKRQYGKNHKRAKGIGTQNGRFPNSGSVTRHHV